MVTIVLDTHTNNNKAFQNFNDAMEYRDSLVLVNEN